MGQGTRDVQSSSGGSNLRPMPHSGSSLLQKCIYVCLQFAGAENIRFNILCLNIQFFK